MRSAKWYKVVCTVCIVVSSGCGKYSDLDESARARDGGEDADASADQVVGTSSSRGRSETAAGRGGTPGGAAMNPAGAMAPPPAAGPSCGECTGFCFFGFCLGGNRDSDEDDAGVPPARTPESGSGGARVPPVRTPESGSGGAPESEPDVAQPAGRCRSGMDCESRVCRDGTCQMPACEDGVCNGGETSVTCAADCGSRCGDGAVNGLETCDDGNVAAADGCSPACTVEAGFACTDGMPNVCRDIDACLTAGCTSGESCRDLPAPAPDGAAGRSCVVNDVCDDGMCTGSENASTCPSDCTRCGDSLCTSAESTMTCPADCARCGDEVCTEPETLATCPSDCHVCNDGVCTEPETRETCPNDCSTCGDEQCTGLETLVSCPADCGTRCGDDLCTGDETLETCPNDCSMCGDGMCTGLETPQSCEVDCPMPMP